MVVLCEKVSVSAVSACGGWSHVKWMSSTHVVNFNFEVQMNHTKQQG